MKGFILICLIIFENFISSLISAECQTPFECYLKAIDTLNVDRKEMRSQLDFNQNLYNTSLVKMEEMKKEHEIKLNQLGELYNSTIGKIEDMKKDFEVKLADLKDYVDRPFTMVNYILYESSKINTNLSVISLNEKIPKIAKKIIIYAAYFSGTGHSENHGVINILTKLNGKLNGRALGVSTYDQNAYDHNSSVFEFDLDKDDFNLYFQSTVDVSSGGFNFIIKLIGYK